jgi:hypothetical protein
MNLSEIITELENKNGIYIYNNKSYFPKVDLDFDRTKFKTGDEKIYVKDSVTGKRFYVLILKLYNDDIENMIRMDIKMDNNVYTEITRMFTFKNTCRTNGFIILSTNNYVEEDKQIILDENIGLVPEDETYVCISEKPGGNGFYRKDYNRKTQFWTTKKLIEQIEKDASDYSGFFGF